MICHTKKGQVHPSVVLFEGNLHIWEAKWCEHELAQERIEGKGESLSEIFHIKTSMRVTEKKTWP